MNSFHGPSTVLKRTHQHFRFIHCCFHRKILHRSNIGHRSSKVHQCCIHLFVTSTIIASHPIHTRTQLLTRHSTQTSRHRENINCNHHNIQLLCVQREKRTKQPSNGQRSIRSQWSKWITHLAQTQKQNVTRTQLQTIALELPQSIAHIPTQIAALTHS